MKTKRKEKEEEKKRKKRREKGYSRIRTQDCRHTGSKLYH